MAHSDEDEELLEDELLLEEDEELLDDDASISSKCSSQVCGWADNSSLVLNSRNFEEAAEEVKQNAIRG